MKINVKRLVDDDVSQWILQYFSFSGSLRGALPIAAGATGEWMA